MIHVKEKTVSNEFEWFQAMGFTALWPVSAKLYIRVMRLAVLVGGGTSTYSSTTTTEETQLRLVREMKEIENGVFLNLLEHYKG